MANEELIALLKNLQGSGAGGALNPGLLAQLPALIAATVEPAQASKETRGSGIASTASMVASTVASTALRTVGGGLTLLPVVSSLLKLFGAGQKQKEELPALENFELPAPIRAEAGLSQSGETFLIDRGAGDRIRQLPAPAPAAASRFAGTQWGSPEFAGSQEGAPQFPANQGGASWFPADQSQGSQFPENRAPSRQPGANTSITVNVQAMDSQSFMDRREDIARAVREAMLQSHSLNDVVSEL